VTLFFSTDETAVRRDAIFPTAAASPWRHPGSARLKAVPGDKRRLAHPSLPAFGVQLPSDAAAQTISPVASIVAPATSGIRLAYPHVVVSEVAPGNRAGQESAPALESKYFKLPVYGQFSCSGVRIAWYSPVLAPVVPFGCGCRRVDRRNLDVCSRSAATAFLSGAAQWLTEFVSPVETFQRRWPTYSIYAQDQWTIKRLTASYGIRFEHLSEYVPAEQQRAVPQFGIPARSFSQVNCVPCWNDVNPRFAAAYDLFGNGKTAVKASIGRYVGAEANSISSANDSVNATVSSASRWSDNNHNLQPDCDLTNPLLNGECGQINPLGLGGPKAVNVYDPVVLNGWNKRGYEWMASVPVDQQLRAGLGVSAGYYRT
jgi:hypothetical protein